MHDRGPEADSAELLRRYRESGDERAFAELVRRYGRMVSGISFRVVGHAPDAEEVCQSTFALLAARAAGLRKRDDAGVARWLAAVALRLAKNRRRVMGRRRHYEAEHARHAALERAGLHCDPHLLAAIDEAVNSLPRPLRDAALACHYRGLDRAAAARELGISPDALRGRLHRANQLIRDRLKRKGLTASRSAVGAAIGCGAEMKAAVVPGAGAGNAWLPVEVVPIALSAGRRGLFAGVGLAAAFALLAVMPFRPAEHTAAKGKPSGGSGRLLERALGESAFPGLESRSRGAVFSDELARRGFGDPPKRRTLNPNDNGFLHLLRMAEAVKEADPDGNLFGTGNELRQMVEGRSEWDEDLAAALDAATEDVFWHWDRMADAQDLQFPVPGEAPYLSGEVPYLSPLQMVATFLMRFEMEATLREHDGSGALESLLKCLEIGRRVEGGEGMGIHYLVGHTIRLATISRLLDLIDGERAAVTAEELMTLQEAMDSLAPRLEDFMFAIAMERAFATCLTASLLGEEDSPGGKLGSLFLALRQNGERGEATLAGFARVDPRMLAEALAERWRRQDESLRLRPPRWPENLSRPAVASLTGRPLAEELAAEADRFGTTIFLSRYHIAVAAHALARVRIALECARLDRYEMTTLTDLVPDYLPVVPEDPFGQGTVRFDPDRSLIWSVGADGVDSGGVPSDGKSPGVSRQSEPSVHFTPSTP